MSWQAQPPLYLHMHNKNEREEKRERAMEILKDMTDRGENGKDEGKHNNRK